MTPIMRQHTSTIPTPWGFLLCPRGQEMVFGHVKELPQLLPAEEFRLCRVMGSGATSQDARKPQNMRRSRCEALWRGGGQEDASHCVQCV